MVAVTVVNLIKDGQYRELSMRNIKMRDELPDTDEAAAQALQEDEAITKAQLGRIWGQPMSARAVLNKLRQDPAGAA